MECSHLPPSVSEIGILFTNDQEIQRLNFEYRGKNKATDVLSFSQIEGISSQAPIATLGDIVISIETAKSQAKQYGNTPSEEILRLLIHGILHLFGYDHEGVSNAKADRMRRKEQALFSKYSRGFNLN